MNIIDYLAKERVLILEEGDKETVISRMASAAKESGMIRDAGEFLNAINRRESIVSTGLGLEVAVPHAKLPSLEAFFIVVAILRKGVEWDAIDQKPVRIVFMIGGPDGNQADYLKILAKVVLLVKNPQRRQKLLQASSPEEVLSLFSNL
jgi:PTS system nitrogen regulatory IIA component